MDPKATSVEESGRIGSNVSPDGSVVTDWEASANVRDVDEVNCSNGDDREANESTDIDDDRVATFKLRMKAAVIVNCFA